MNKTYVQNSQTLCVTYGWNHSEDKLFLGAEEALELSQEPPGCKPVMIKPLQIRAYIIQIPVPVLSSQVFRAHLSAAIIQYREKKSKCTDLSVNSLV